MPIKCKIELISRNYLKSLLCISLAQIIKDLNTEH